MHTTIHTRTKNQEPCNKMELEFKSVNKVINLNHYKNKETLFNEIQIQVIDFLNLYLESKIKLKTTIELDYIIDGVIHRERKEFKFNLNNPPENILKFYEDLNFPLNSIYHEITIENEYTKSTILMIHRDSERLQRKRKFLKKRKTII